MVSFIRL